jgi:hypothetical protein
LSAHFGLQRGALSLDFEGRVDLPASVSVSGEGSLEATLFAGMLVPCWHHSVFSVCGVGIIGALRGRGVDLDQTTQETSVFGAAGVRLAASLRLSRRFALRFHADPLAVVSRTTLRANDEDVWSSPPFSLSIGTVVVGELW